MIITLLKTIRNCSTHISWWLVHHDSTAKLCPTCPESWHMSGENEVFIIFPNQQFNTIIKIWCPHGIEKKGGTGCVVFDEFSNFDATCSENYNNRRSHKDINHQISMERYKHAAWVKKTEKTMTQRIFFVSLRHPRKVSGSHCLLSALRVWRTMAIALTT